jgi:molybdate transport system substrate-binding protein
MTTPVLRRLSLVLLLLAAGCGGSGEHEVTVYAASSLTEAFEELAPDARFNFAGSDELATQIREGARADVYAAASPRYPDELRAEGLVERPRVFATNRLVLVTRPGADVDSVADLRPGGVKLVIAAEGVPVGDYTRAFLARLGERRVLDNLVSEEEDVKGVLGKVRLGEADAGFVYATDAYAAAGEVRAVELPARAQEPIRYPVAIVRDARHRAAAERFVERLLGAEGRRALREAGFGLP